MTRLCGVQETILGPDGEKFTATCTLTDLHKGKCVSQIESESGVRIHIVWDPTEGMEEFSR